MLGRLVVLRAIDRAYRSLAGYASFKLRLYFPGAPLLDGIGAATADQHPRDYEQERQGFHLHILGSGRAIARERVLIADCRLRNADLDQSHAFNANYRSQIQNPKSEI
jgi:hypothetical protein